MIRSPAALVASVAWSLLLSARVLAVSAVFDGDPRDPLTQLPYEILPGHALVQPGPDGMLGTADDVVNPTVIGDIDLVVRAGILDASPVIPPPAIAVGRSALPVGIAGPPNAGGTAIPFTVFLSTGITTGTEPAGRLLAAADMDGIPVFVAAFADLDGDGFIGPTSARAAGADAHLQVRELEPVGRGAALFSGGVAHGTVAVSRGLPASRGGLTVALVAMALTGPLDPAFQAGVIPSGPAISTALPFLPIRDLSRLIRDRPAAPGPNTTLQDLIQPAAIPQPDTYAIPLDGSSPTVDAAVVKSQPAVRVSFRRSTRDREQPLDRLVLGTTAPADRLNVRLVPVDRFENPADPPPGWRIAVKSDDPLQIVGQQQQTRPLRIASPRGRRVLARLKPGSTDGTSGGLRVELGGTVIAALSFEVDSRANRPAADLSVPSDTAATIQQAVDIATDRNGDGVIAVRIHRGVFREHVTVSRPVDLRGAGADATFIVGDGTTAALALSAPGAAVRDVTVAGGAPGVQLAGSGARMATSKAWRNIGTGVVLAGTGTELWASSAIDNGSGGLTVGAVQGARCAEALLRGNQGPGLSAQSTGSLQVLHTETVENNGAGLTILGATNTEVRSSQSVLNFGPGIELSESSGSVVTENICAANDDDGLRMDRAGGAAVTGNTAEDNKGYGLFVRRSADADFGTAPGTQPPPGDNTASGNRKGDVLVRTN